MKNNLSSPTSTNPVASNYSAICVKGILFCCLIFVTGMNQLQAQDNTIGFKGGVNFTNLYIDQVDDENAKFGFNAGMFYKARITDFFAIQPELFYSLQGAEVTYESSLLKSGGKVKYNLGYINMPILAVVNVTKNFNLHAGPYGGLLAVAKVKDVSSSGNTNYQSELDRDDFNTLDYGLSAGIGIDFEAGTLGLRYNYGLREIGKENTTVGSLTKNSKNSVFQLYFGFNF